MPRYNVQNPDTGLRACFSGICDEFVTGWMSKDEYETWRRKVYGVDIEPAEACNMMDYEEAMQMDLFMKFEQGRIAPVVQAHWILDGKDPYNEHANLFTCSKCGLGRSFHTNPPAYNYCPWCGAKMDGGGDDGKS